MAKITPKFSPKNQPMLSAGSRAGGTWPRTCLCPRGRRCRRRRCRCSRPAPAIASTRGCGAASSPGPRGPACFARGAPRGGAGPARLTPGAP
ncbi:uncharacterized protein LOC115917154 isoform X2 [Camarhynchus parvulus]|uniref:uncharacterized protein LOC115917154 isoform X2 n=1 Tax=Geospiza parvula TaxID=87175 RepID=UPI0012383B21|nr:uncharacterized protein LOC115917154 isoform X2 [Camarhynchus parvulus]